MIATFKPCRLSGSIDAPPSKSMAHRLLIGAALSGKLCTLSGVDYSEDILATIDCLKALGADITIAADQVTVDPAGFMQVKNPVLNCRESGSTLRFFLPIALCLQRPVVLQGSRRLLERPLDVYEDICKDRGFAFQKEESAVTVCGNLSGGNYLLRGDISSQFISGLMLALTYLNTKSTIQILLPFESRSYVDLTISALRSFGANIQFSAPDTIEIAPSQLHAFHGRIEGDYSNAAFLDVFNYLGADIDIKNLNTESLQGDKLYPVYFQHICDGSPVIDISNCPDLGPVLIALAALKGSATLIGTDRLKAKESDRGLAMHQELKKLGGGLIFGENSITVPKQNLQYRGKLLSSHNDHRIVMALSVILANLGGAIEGAQAVRKSYPGFFDDIQKLGANVEIS